MEFSETSIRSRLGILIDKFLSGLDLLIKSTNLT